MFKYKLFNYAFIILVPVAITLGSSQHAFTLFRGVVIGV